MTAEEKVEIIKQDPKYGKVICRCETITEGEIIDVIHRSALAPAPLNRLKNAVVPEWAAVRVVSVHLA